MSNIQELPSVVKSDIAKPQTPTVPKVTESSEGGCFKRKVILPSLERLSYPVSNTSRMDTSINVFAIEIPTKICRPKVLNKYIPLYYSNNIDDGIFDYSHDGKAVFHPTIKWTDRPHTSLITYDINKDSMELDNGLRIGKCVLDYDL